MTEKEPPSASMEPKRAQHKGLSKELQGILVIVINYPFRKGMPESCRIAIEDTLPV